MSRNTKRKLDDFDPNKSDSDDEDYDNTAPSSARPKTRVKSVKSRNTGRKPPKRKRERYGDSDDDIEDDEDGSSEEEDSFSDESDGEEELNPATGRRQRAAARRPVKYDESSEDEISATSDDEPTSPTKSNRSKPSQSKQTLIVRLQISPEKMPQTRSRRPPSKRGPTPDLPVSRARRSSRISQSEEPMFQLTDSGRLAEMARRSSGNSVDQSDARQTRGGKSVKKHPSAIMEASQEDSGPIEAPDEEDGAKASIAAGLTDDDAHMKDELDHGGEDIHDPTNDVVPSSNPEVDEKSRENNKAEVDDDDDDDDDEPIVRRASRTLRTRRPASPPSERRSLRNRSKAPEQSSDFEPDAEEDEGEENISDEDKLAPHKSRSGKGDESDSVTGRRSGRLARRNRSSQRASGRSESGGSELDLEEIADEAASLEEDRRRNKRPRRTRRTEEISYEPQLRNRSNRPDYRVFRPELQAQLEEDDTAVPPPVASQGRARKAAGPYRTLFSTLGPFGGAGGPLPVFGGVTGGAAAAGGADSDSSDDETMRRPSHAMGGAVGMTPTQAQTPFGLVPQPHNSDAAQAGSGAPANFGKVKDRKALADADPLGVDPNVSFDGVGGLGDHIDRLKEMVALPLLYPEIFMRMHVTPPRGVLFHGPPGTGKTLLARALASSVSSNGKKVTFYMRKGADALSKWVGEAERQLRLLFEEARKNQPSIIFFDEIDGLAPVRSSKQEQIHASIVATLLALMDGMDGRGQVIVIGATNRPDSVDPALRRPGRFDREFYFPLPNKDARRSIIDIHTKGWDPPLKPLFKDQLAELTKGYGGADLRALCTEAALNAVQGTYPQIYTSNKKLLIDPTKIKVLAKDFMISVNKIIPSSERSATSASAPLKKSVEPLLRNSLAEVETLLKDIVPRTKKRTALEEAEYDDRDDEFGFEKENLQREFEGARIFRPRLLIHGLQGMGQQYLGAALLNKFEGMYVANFDLPNIYKDSTRSPEAAIVQMIEEVKRHKPSVVYIPNVDIWYHSLQDSVIKTFTGLLRALPPTDPVLLLGVMEAGSVNEAPDKAMMRDLFSYSAKNVYKLKRPDALARHEYFSVLIDYIRRSPAEFPDPENRKKREIPQLPEAPLALEAPKAPTKDQLKSQKKQDRHTLNTLKLHIQQVMDQIKLKYRKFRSPPVDERAFAYLFDEQDPGLLTTDLAEDEAQQHMYRPYRLDKDRKGVNGLREVATGKFYYNLEIVTIEQRLSNGYYKRPSDFLADIKRLAKDAKTMGDQERILKANEMYANVEVDMTNLEKSFPALAAECEAVYYRELAREAEGQKKAHVADHGQLPSNVPVADSNSTDPSTGPIHLGIHVPANRSVPPPFTPNKSDMSNGVGEHHQEDIEMGNADDHNSKAADGQYSTPAQGFQPKSQHSSIMQMAPGSQPRDYVNSASTTTSGHKTSDRSNRDSGHTGNTQLSNGVSHGNGGVDFSMIEPISGSQLPDTQEQGGSQITPHSSPQHSQVMGPPTTQPHGARRSSDIDSLLNHPSTSQAPTSMRAPILIPADHTVLAEMNNQLVARSSGLSVEQLEQVMAALMRAIWESKREWNRNLAAKAVEEAFNDTMRDLESVQEIMKPSQDDDEYPTGMGKSVGGLSGASVAAPGGVNWWGAQSAP
ncbi:AAA-domain-containing protein [Myriangium duriaei CBS 260.36]|uniref:AAA-domain-containing protein n=1 Tax=Myriangium duriaei CBS 260.36 TaxID=1168546 RepID=A0A9P4MIH6_9PEZI|nr:AAA-domain-containing protein [Myriangium duriaei CBS 260.36]